MKPERYFVIDFDCTFTQVESPEELAAIALKGNPQKEAILKKTKEITDAAMEGKISIADAIARRLELIRPEKKHVELLAQDLKKKITPSIARNKKFFKKYARNIYIVSSGFKEFIVPVVKSFGIPADHVFGNTYLFDKSGAMIGFDRQNPLAQANGKAKLVKQLGLKGEVYVIGDGYTDYEIKKEGFADKFFAFTENVTRQAAVKNADYVARSFDEFLYLNGLPRAESYPKTRIHVLLLENIHADAVAEFKREGYTVETVTRSLDEDELLERIKDVAVLGIRSKTEVTKKVLEHAPKLQAVGAFCIGTNQIDIDECLKRGVVVFNAPYSNTRSVVELAIAEIIMLMRGAFDKSMKLHQGIWDKSSKGCFEIRGKTLGIVGYGNIGTQLSVVAESLGMQVCFHDIVPKLAMGNAHKCDSLGELLKRSDIVTLHVDGNPKNQNLIGERELKLMKEGAALINLSRGFIVDLAALAKYIRSGKLRGAAVDVFPKEPKSNDEKFVSDLQALPNVILTPHIGGSTEEAQKNIGEFVSAKLTSFINTGDSFLSVNFPGIQLPELKHAHRFVHVHRNMPGVLAAINGILAKRKINILGQYLKTNDTIGYVITDVGTKYDAEVIQELRAAEHTIRFRVLY